MFSLPRGWCIIGDVIYPLNAMFFGTVVYKFVFKMSPIDGLSSFWSTVSPQNLTFKAQDGVPGSDNAALGMFPAIWWLLPPLQAHNCCPRGFEGAWHSQSARPPCIYISVTAPHTTMASTVWPASSWCVFHNCGLPMQ